MTRILLIEQETLYQKAFAKMIEKTDNCCLIGIAESGMEAMDMMGKFHPQVVFSEVLMGNENGIDICKNIRAEYPDTTVYIVSNYRSMNLINKAMEAGMENYLTKPVAKKTLLGLFSDSTQTEEIRYSKDLLLSIEARDYQQSYHVTKEYVDKIFSIMNVNERRNEFKATASSLLYLIPGLDRAQHDYYMEKYELTSKILSKNVLSCCWMMQIVTEVYRQLCVVKYGHMNRVLQYIENNINNEISLSDLAEQAGVSSGYLSRIFKKYYYISIVDYIHLRKILIAKQYMVSSELNISDISFLLGYSEAGYFCKIFKKYEEMTPSAFNHAYVG